jgi:hypothetical protein
VRPHGEETLKTTIVILLVGTACAQVPIKPNELACGNATLTLSMPEARAVQILKDNGYTLADKGLAGETNLPIEIWEGLATGLCQLSFSGGKLVYVERYWKPRTGDARDAVEAVINAIESVTERQNHSTCDVFSYTKTEPSVTHKAVTVTCGGHKIALSVIDTNQLHTYEIEESIGSFLKNRP